MGNSEGMSPLGGPKHRWKDNINIDFTAIGCGGMDLIYLLQDRLL